MINITQQTHTSEPKDVFEAPYAMLHYYTSEHIAGENISYTSVAVSTDEAKDFTDIEALKEHFKKQARKFAAEHNIVSAADAPLEADTNSIATMGAMIVGALAMFAQALSAGSKPKEAYQQSFLQKVPFKCADNEVRALTIEEIAHAHKDAQQALSDVWLEGEAIAESAESAQTEQAEAKDVPETPKAKDVPAEAKAEPEPVAEPEPKE